MEELEVKESVAEMMGEKKKYKNYQDYLGRQLDAIIRHTKKYKKLFDEDTPDPDIRKTILEQLEKFRKSDSISLRKSEIYIAEKNLRIAYNLDDLHWFCIFVGVIKKFENPAHWFGIARIIDAPDEPLSYETLLKFYYLVKETSEIENFNIKLKNLKSKLSELGYSRNNAEIPTRLDDIINLNLENDPSPNCLTIYYYTNNTKGTPLSIREEKAELIHQIISSTKTEETLFYFMEGSDGIGKKALVKRACKLTRRKLIIINLQTAKDDYGNEWFDKLSEIIYENKDSKAILCLDKFHALLDIKTELIEEISTVDALKVLRLVKKYFALVFVLSDEKLDELPFKRKHLWFSDSISELDDEENLKLWQKHMAAIAGMTEETADDIADKFKFTPAQIEGAVAEAKAKFAMGGGRKLDKKQFARCVYSQSMNKLGDMARLISEPYTWDDIVLHKK